MSDPTLTNAQRGRHIAQRRRRLTLTPTPILLLTIGLLGGAIGAIVAAIATSGS